MDIIWLHHVLRLSGKHFLTNGTMAYSCRGLYQITRYYQTGRRILGYQMTWYGLGWWVNGPSTSQILGPHSKWECTQCHNHVTLLLGLYPLVHWWLLNMNCKPFHVTQLACCFNILQFLPAQQVSVMLVILHLLIECILWSAVSGTWCLATLATL